MMVISQLNWVFILAKIDIISENCSTVKIPFTTYASSRTIEPIFFFQDLMYFNCMKYNHGERGAAKSTLSTKKFSIK